ncbi:porin family protein [Marinomonas transparens]|uniref:Porin family protein n=1 Tax=Marinomonas transparens TaxID=2795388 RepID=A0A934MZP3_9GAMM|nr:porin family protein [Marinomonas transparens]MBJ7537760.1 porin family protein [Marinomonas transparens]
MKKILVGMFAASGMTLALAAETPFIAEVLIGQSSQKVSNLADGDDSSTGIRLGYEFSDGWSVEGAFHDHGGFNYSSIDDDNKESIDYSTSSTTLGVKKTFDLSEGLSLNVHGGLALWNFDWASENTSTTTITTKTTNDSGSNSGSDVYYGLGLSYELKQNLLLSLEYSFLSMSIDSDKVDVSNFALGLGYKF